MQKKFVNRLHLVLQIGKILLQNFFEKKLNTALEYGARDLRSSQWLADSRPILSYPHGHGADKQADLV